MFQVRIHGRGGQGVVTAAEMLSIAAFDRGPPRAGLSELRLRAHRRSGRRLLPHRRHGDPGARADLEPDALIVQDPTLLHQVDVFSGLAPDGYILINSGRSFDELGLGEFVERFRPRAPADASRPPTWPASTSGRPIPNAALVGGFAALSGLISLDVRDRRHP